MMSELTTWGRAEGDPAPISMVGDGTAGRETVDPLASWRNQFRPDVPGKRSPQWNEGILEEIRRRYPPGPTRPNGAVVSAQREMMHAMFEGVVVN